MKKLAISFVTFNRAKNIKEDLDIISQPTKKYGIDIYIYDGSTNTHTEYVVRKFIENGNNHIYYFHSDKDLSMYDSSLQRITEAFNQPAADYIWLCGDRFVINPDYYSKILSYIDKSYDIVTIYGGILRGTRQFNKQNRFLDYAIVPITAYGSTIIKKELIEPFDMQKAKKENLSFYVQLTYLRAIANIEDFKGVVIDGGQQAFCTSKYKTKSASRNHMWDSWVVNWYNFVYLLPDIYGNIREKLFNRPDLQMGFFSMGELLRQRSEKQFNLKKFIECKTYVKKVIALPKILVFGIAILPQSIAKWLYAIKY